jgi:hypothetical protein
MLLSIHTYFYHIRAFCKSFGQPGRKVRNVQMISMSGGTTDNSEKKIVQNSYYFMHDNSKNYILKEVHISHEPKKEKNVYHLKK